MTKNTAILLVNMGSPRSEREMRSFLKAMFSDKAIIPLPSPARWILSRLISNLRYKASWKKYQLIGGSPLVEDTEATAQALASTYQLNVFTAYSYIKPSVLEQMKLIKNNGFKHLCVISMYPQDSYTTTASVKWDVEQAQQECAFDSISFAPAYATSTPFIKYWGELVKTHMQTQGITKPLLLCVAHSIPISRVKQGDNYPFVIEKMGEMLATHLGLVYRIAYQSQVGPQKWLEPYIEPYTEELIKEGHKEILILPVSFTTECLETEYDLSLGIVNKYKDDNRVQHISRVYLPSAHPLFINTLKHSIDAAK